MNHQPYKRFGPPQYTASSQEAKLLIMRCEAIGYLEEALGSMNLVKKIVDQALLIVIESFYYSEGRGDVYESIGTSELFEGEDSGYFIAEAHQYVPLRFKQTPEYLEYVETFKDKLECYYNELLYFLTDSFLNSKIADTIQGLQFDPVGDYTENLKGIPYEELVNPIHRYRVERITNGRIVIARGDYGS